MRRISLAAGVLPEFDPITIARCAAQSGFSDAGVMVRPDQWDVRWESQLLDLKAAGLGYLDVEVLWIPAGGELDSGHDLIVDVGNRLGADFLLVVSDEARADYLAPALQHISQRCWDSGMRPCLEFLRITQVQSLAQARELLVACEAYDFGILIDTLHLQRSGEFALPDGLDLQLHPYVQLCDGNQACATDQAALLEDALDLRSIPGQGELPLKDFLQRLPEQLPLSLEVRSKALRDGFSDPLQRAQALFNQTQLYLGATDE